VRPIGVIGFRTPSIISCCVAGGVFVLVVDGQALDAGQCVATDLRISPRKGILTRSLTANLTTYPIRGDACTEDFGWNRFAIERKCPELRLASLVGRNSTAQNLAFRGPAVRAWACSGPLQAPC
jgi:hypothetical protein